MIKLCHHGVYLDNLHPQLWQAFPKIEALFDYLEKDVVILSARDGNHPTNSLHYEGRAIDIKSRGLRKGPKTSILTSLKALGEGWDVTLVACTGKECYHLEWRGI